MELKIDGISQEDMPILQSLCRNLIVGKTIYYSDTMMSRIGNFYSTVRNETIHEFGKTLYEFTNDNYDQLKKLFLKLGFQLNRESHSLSVSQNNRFCYYLGKLQLQNQIKEERYQSLQTGDALTLSALMIETNMGTQFINYEEDFLKKLLDEPRQLLKTDVNFVQLAKLMMPRAVKISDDEDTRTRVWKKVDERIKKVLVPYNFVILIQNIQKQYLVSIGPASFRFSKMVRTLNTTDNKNENLS